MFRVDPGLATPPFEQLRTQAIALIDSGELLPGAQLPTVRRLAADLGLATNTVARAYRELETQGYVETAGRRGTVVAGKSSVGRAAQHAAETFGTRMHELGISSADALRLVRTALDGRP